MPGHNNLAVQATTEPKTKLLAGETLMQTMLTNSKVRKSLSEQIDRLDKILDGLAEALNGAVADAVTQAVSLAVKETVQSVLTEVLSNPDLRARLQGSAATPANTPVAGLPTARSIVNWVGTTVTRFTSWCSARLSALGQVSRRIVQYARWAATDVSARISRLGFLVPPLAAALLLGVATGIAAYCVGPWLAGLVGGAGSLGLRLALHVRRWVCRAWDSQVLAVARAAFARLIRWGVV
jgi:hypothetical protein